MGVALANKPTFWGAAVTAIARATPGRVFSCLPVSANAALRYFQLFDRTTALAGGEVPTILIPVPNGYIGPLAFGPELFTVDGTPFFNGIVWGFSTTAATYTAATAADHDVTLLISN
jgi:hypothetical protein